MIKKYSKELDEFLSKNFRTSEFHCKCKRKECTTTLIDEALVYKLQQVRDEVGRPLRVNSAYRCEAHNAAVGGSPTSQHLQGKAADITPSQASFASLKSVMMRAIDKVFNGVGIYSSFIHVDTREKKARWFGS